MIVEDGTGRPDADALIDVVYADGYHALRGNAAWALLDNAQKEASIVLATDYFELVYGACLIAGKSTETQALSMPTTLGMLVSVKKVVAILALTSAAVNLFPKMLPGADGNAATQGEIIETTEKVDTLVETIKYATPTVSDATGVYLVVPQVASAMAPLIKTGATGAYR